VYVVSATLRKDYVNNSNEKQVKFCHTLYSNMAR